MTTPEGGQTPQIELTLLKEATAPKLSKRSTGRTLQYRLWTNAERSDVFWQIAANEGGQHSLELVPMTKVQAAVGAVAGSEPFRTRTLRGAFSGKSTNNAGFLLCAMHAEGLLAASDKAHHYLAQGQWQDWLQAALSLEGQLASIAAPLAATVLPADTAEPVTKGRRGTKRKALTDEEEEHADAA